MRKIPRFYATKKLIPRQVPKYDIREPGPYPHLWRGGNWAQNTHPQECIFAAKDSNKNGNRYPHQKKNIGKQLAQKENTQNTDKHDHTKGKTLYTRYIPTKTKNNPIVVCTGPCLPRKIQHIKCNPDPGIRLSNLINLIKYLFS